MGGLTGTEGSGDDHCHDRAVLKRKEPVRLTYDPKHNIAYIKLRETTQPVETVRISDDINIDLTPNGTVQGIELLDANNQLKSTDGGQLVLVDPSGTERTLPLAG